MKIILIIWISFFSLSVFASTRTFSCNGPDIHFETDYQAGINQVVMDKVVLSPNGKIILGGHLKVEGSEEFMQIVVKFVDSGLEVSNNRSGLGQPSQGNFNFVNLEFKNMGGADPTPGRPYGRYYQCQSYPD